MFHSTRIRLTGWYLCIIMLISMMFSLIIYKGADIELNRIAYRQHIFSERWLRIEGLLRQPTMMPRFEPIPVEEIRQRVIFTLLVINGAILVVSGLAGYFLAGQTLNPIKNMIDEQHRFIADASHEFRTPLTAIRTSIEVDLRDKNLTMQKAKSLLHSNLEEVENLQHLADTLLLLAQAERPNGISYSTIAINLIIEESCRKLASLAKNKEIVVEKDIEQVEIKGDKKSLIELFTILIDNAIKYSRKSKSILINVKKLDGKVEIRVKDFGVGIAAKDLPHIFERFYRADSARSKTKIDGYGLGLSIAKKIVELHNGNITVESKVNKETTVVVKFPSYK